VLQQRRVICAVFLAAAIAASGCSDSPSQDATATSRAADATDGVQLLVWPAEGEQQAVLMTAFVGGRVHIDTGNDCVLLKSPEASYPILWPRGTTAEDGKIALATGQIVHENDHVRGDGGFVSLDQANEMLDTSYVIPASCRAPTGDVAAFNQESRIDVG
jgi:hypothetical protein